MRKKRQKEKKRVEGGEVEEKYEELVVYYIRESPFPFRFLQATR